MGTIVNVQDEGMQETPWGAKHKISVRIDSNSAFMENEEPFRILEWFTLSSSPKSNLRKFREAVLDRSLTKDEETEFDPEAELVGRRISYRVDHKEKQDGGLRAVIRDGSVEPVDGTGEAKEVGTSQNMADSETDVDRDGDGQTPTADHLPF